MSEVRNRLSGKLTEPALRTHVAEFEHGQFQASFSYDGEHFIVGTFTSANEAQIRALLAFRGHLHKTKKP